MSQARDQRSTNGLQQAPAGSGPGAAGKQTLTGGLTRPSSSLPSTTAGLGAAPAAAGPATDGDQQLAAPAQPGAEALAPQNVSFDLDTTTVTGVEGGFSGSVTVTVTGSAPVLTAGGYTLFAGGADPPSQCTGQFENGKLVRIEGELPFSVRDTAAFIAGRIRGSYLVDSKQLSGTATSTLVRDHALGGVGDDQIVLVSGSALTATLAGSTMPAFKSAGGQLTASVRERGQEWARAQLSGDYVPGAAGGFTGTATVTVTGRKQLVTAGGHTLSLGGTGAQGPSTGRVEAGKLVRIDGNLPFSLAPQGGELLATGHVNGTYTAESKQLTGTGTATLVRDQVLGGIGEDQIVLVGGSTLTATLAGSTMPAFKGAGGQLTASVRERGQEWARAQLSGDYVPGAAGGFTGTAAVTVTGTKQIVTIGSHTLRLGGTGAQGPSTGQFEAGKLVRIEGNIPFSLAPQGGELLATGVVDGTYTAESKQLDGTGTATLVRDQVLGQVGDDKIVLLAGSKLTATLAGSAMPRLGGAGGQLTASVREREQEWATAQISGDYVPGQAGGFTGTAAVTVTGTKQLATIGSHSLRLGGTGAQGPSTGRFEAGKLVRIEGNIPFSLAPQGGEALVTGHVDGTYTAESKQLDGTGTATLVRDQVLGEVGDDKLVLLAGSTLTATLAGSAMPKLSGAGGQLTASVREREQEWATAQISGDYVPGQAGGFTGTAAVTVTGTKQLATLGTHTLLLGGAAGQGQSTGRFEAGKLVRIEGHIPFSLAVQGGEALVTGHVDGTYTAESKQLDGTGEATLVRDQVLGEVGDDKLVLLAGSTLTATLAGSAMPKLSGAGGQLTASVREREQEWATAKISGDYVPGQAGGFTGTAAVTVTGTKQLATLGSHTLLLGGAAGQGQSTGQFEAGKLVRIEGHIPFSLALQGGEPLVTGHIDGTYTAESKQLDGTGEATLVRDQVLGEIGDDKLVLLANSTLTATLAGSAMPVLTGAGGQLTASVREREQEWATAQISGEFVPGQAGGFTGTTAVTITGQKQLATIGSFTLFLGGEAGGAAGRGQSSGRFEAGKLVQIEGRIPFSVSHGGEPFATGLLDGSYTAESKQLTGAGTATLVRDQQLGGVGDDQLVLAAGSTMTATLAESGPPVFNSASGQLTASVREQGQEWATAQIGGEYAPGAAGGFTGTAAVTVTRQKQVATIGAYTLFLGGTDGAAAQGQSTGRFEAGKLVQIEGQIPFSVSAGEGGTLATGLLDGSYTPDPGVLNGTGQMNLARDRDHALGEGSALRVKQGTGGTIAITQNQLQQLTGTIAAEILSQGQPEISFTGQGTFDVPTSSVVTATGTATLLRTLEPFGAGVVQVTGLSGGASVTNNALEKLSGQATVKLPRLHDSQGQFGITWEKREGKDLVSGSGLIDVILVPRQNGRGTQGKIAFTFDGTDKFTAIGDVMVSLSETIGGSVGMKMDERLDPEIDGNMKLQSELVSATQLFNQRLDIMPERSIQAQAGPVPLTLSFGALGGFQLGLDPLQLDASVAISRWKPLSEGSSVPTFDHTARVGWGMDATGLAAAWVKLGLGVPGLNAGAGVKGGATLDAPLTPNIELELHSGADGFWGELGVGLSLRPELNFNVTPFLYANLFNFGNEGKQFEHELGNWTWNLGEVGRFDWGKNYQFGDRREVTDRPAVPMLTGPATQTNTVHTAAPEVPATAITPPAPKPGGPDLGSIGSLLGGDFANNPAMSQLLENMELLQKVAEGVAAIGYLGEQIGDLLAAVTMFGPPGLAITLVYKLLTREITWEKLTTAVRKAAEGIKATYEILSPYLPGWWQKLMEIVDKGINIFDEWWNGDRHMREAVDRGEHQYANAEMKGRMIDRMLDFWTGTEDKHAVLTILESGGDEHAVVAVAGWDKIKGRLSDGADSVQERFSRWCEQRGLGRREWVNGPLFFDHWEWRWTGVRP